jgi:hypothetical protein
MAAVGFFSDIGDGLNSVFGLQWVWLAIIAIVILVLLMGFVRMSLTQSASVFAMLILFGLIAKAIVTPNWLINGIIIIIGVSLAYAIYWLFLK